MTDDGRKILVVGASAAGLRCAARLARLRPGWSIRVVEARDDFSYGACGMPYVLSGDVSDIEHLHRTSDGAVRDAAFFARVKGVEVLSGRRAVDVDAEARTLTVRDAEGVEEILEWDELVLATGARTRRLRGQPEHPRVVSFHEPEDVKPLHDGLARGTIGRAVIVGAGLVGCELAEAFTAMWGAEVVLVEAGATPLPELLDPETAGHVAKALADEDVELRMGAPVESIEADDEGVTVNIAGGEPVTGDVAVVAVGVTPATELAVAAGCRLGPTGAVAVDERMATSVPHVWAAGDAAECRHAVTDEPCYLPLGSLANRMGRTLADVLAGRDAVFPPVCGASACKVFDLNVAATGLTRRRAAAAGKDARAVWILGYDRADYFPGVGNIALQLTYLPASRRVIGVQAVGPGEVAKRVDAATQLIARGAVLSDFVQYEHAYAPPYAPALDPLAVSAMVAENREDGVTPLAPGSLRAGEAILDVRHDAEAEERPLDLPDVVRIPLESLRERIGDVDLRPWVVVCERGTRSAEAVRMLSERDIPASYLGGGLRWRFHAGDET